MNRKVSIWEVIKNVQYLCLKNFPITHFSTGLIMLIRSLFIVLSFLMTQLVFDQATALYQGSIGISSLLIPILLFALIKLGMEILRAIEHYLSAVVSYSFKGVIDQAIAKKADRLDPIMFEDPNILDEINKAREISDDYFYVGDLPRQILLSHTAYLIFLGFYLYTLNPILILAVLFAFIPKLIPLWIKPLLYSKLQDKSAPMRREYEFYEQAMTSRTYLKETRILGAFSLFKQKYLATLTNLNREMWKTDATSATLDLAMSLLTVLGYIGVLYLLFISLQAGAISIGAFAVVFASFVDLVARIDEAINNFDWIAEDLGTVSSLVRFFDLPERSGDEKAIDWTGDIEIKNISFTYPNAEFESLKNLSLTIKSGETVAIVGENGAGKSTLMKILMGIYEPTTGNVVIGHQNTRGIANSTRFKGVSAVFQKFQQYQLTLKENIEISESNRNADIILPMEQAGVEYNSKTYPDGIDTTLSREFDGVDLSGGQWQRIAIARGLYRYHDLIVLDEPTAAIDPLEESRLYEKFAEISKDKTAIIVTHRLGSAQIADKIVVLNHGQISEIGTHRELLASGGHYAKMYESQASWYMN